MTTKKFKAKYKSIITFALVVCNIISMQTSVMASDAYKDTYKNITNITFEEQYQKLYENFNTTGHTLLRKTMNAYNAMSFKYVEATHIVGPIATNNSAYRTRASINNPIPSATNPSTESNTLIFADYSRGMPSFVRNIIPRTATISDGAYEPTFKMNYTFDMRYLPFTYPTFVTTEDVSLYNGGASMWDIQQQVQISTGAKVLSPNTDGRYTKIQQNDDYITASNMASQSNYTIDNDVSLTSLDYDEVWQYMVAESKGLLSKNAFEDDHNVDGSKTKTYTGAETKITVEMGETINIMDASALTEIDITFDQNLYDYSLDPCLEPTLINIHDTQINTTSVNGKSASQLPVIKINGSQFTTGAGEYYEYNELGNKIIINMPNIVTTGEENRVVTLLDGQNLPGHYLMPQAELYNYDNAGKWEGGNINGCVIAQSIHSGNAELHMWPYDGRAERMKEEDFTHVVLQEFIGLKNLDNSPSKTQFAFVIQHTYSEDEYGVPLDEEKIYYEILSKEDGSIQFPELTFKLAGIYKFDIKENVGKNSYDNIIYDKSEYELVVKVVKNTSTQKLEFESALLTRISDSNGDAVSGTSIDILKEDVGDYVITFDNETISFVLPTTGGYGKFIYTITGLGLVLISIKLKRKI